MKVLALSVKGAEYLYKASTAHKVSKASAEKIAAALNKAGYKTDGGRLVWYAHDVADWETAGIYASAQAFRVYRGSVKRTLT